MVHFGDRLLNKQPFKTLMKPYIIICIVLKSITIEFKKIVNIVFNNKNIIIALKLFWFKQLFISFKDSRVHDLQV